MYREWSTVWLEQPIVVKVWYHNTWFFRLREELWVSGLLVDRNKMAILAQRAKNVLLHFKLLLAKAFSYCDRSTSTVRNHTSYLEFMHFESSRRVGTAHQLGFQHYS